jgi:prepilin-type N-terminal cleavage/methylation domain-containing protein
MEIREKSARSKQRGMSLVELIIAMTVLMIGTLGCAVAIPFAINTNYGNKQQSNATVFAQMVLEKLMAVPSGATSTTVTDCANNSNTITATPGGSTVNSYGAVDFSQTQGSSGAPAGYYMNYTTCGANGQTAVYDVRWNIQALGDAKLVTVSAKLRSGNVPSTLRSMIGTGN